MIRHNSYRHLFLAIALAGGVAAAVLAGGCSGSGDSGGPGSQTVVPGIVQDISSTGGGVTLDVSRAAFSGTGSWLSVRVSVDEEHGGVEQVRLPSAALSGTLAPIENGPGIVLPVGQEVILRLAPLSGDAAPSLETRAVDLRQEDGSWRRVEGSWSLPLMLGGDPREVLHVDRFTPGDARTDNGVTVRPVSAVRSVTETLVAMEIDGPQGITAMVLPRVAGSSPPIYGARVEENGNLVTFSFPALPADKALRIDMGEFIVPVGDGDASHVDIDIAAAMDRQGVTGRFAEVAIVEPTDQGRSTAAPAVLQVEFVRTSDGGPSNALNVYVEGSYEDASGFTLQLPGGETLMPRGSGTNFPIDSSGNVVEGTTFITFVFGDDIGVIHRGPVRLNLGAPSTVLRGNWTVEYRPQ